METLEAAISVVIDDFEVGDRVYSRPWKGSQLSKTVASKYIPTCGRVLAVHKDGIDVILDNGASQIYVDIMNFTSVGHFRRCFKGMEDLKEGALLSCFNGVERIYADVVFYQPGVSISLYFHKTSKEVKIVHEPSFPLEYQLWNYQLED